MAKKKGKEPDKMAYGEAVEEVETILESIDRDEVDVDELSAKVERAVGLLRHCRDKLRATDARVQEVLAEMENDAPVESAAEVSATRAGAAGAGARSAPTASPAESSPSPASSGGAPPLRDEDFEEESDELPF